MPDSSVKRLGRWLGIIEDPTWDPDEGDENTTEVYTDEVVYEPSTITSLEERRQVQHHGTGATAVQPGHRVTQQYSESDHAGVNTSMGNTMGTNASIANQAAAPASMAAAEPQRVVTVHPRTYNEARTIGEHFRDGVPVIMNLSDMEDTDAKRLVDFAAGLIFGLRGRIERVTNKVFLLSPQNVTVSADDKERIASGSFYNQS